MNDTLTTAEARARLAEVRADADHAALSGEGRLAAYARGRAIELDETIALCEERDALHAAIADAADWLRGTGRHAEGTHCRCRLCGERWPCDITQALAVLDGALPQSDADVTVSRPEALAVAACSRETT